MNRGGGRRGGKSRRSAGHYSPVAAQPDDASLGNEIGSSQVGKPRTAVGCVTKEVGGMSLRGGGNVTPNGKVAQNEIPNLSTKSDLSSRSDSRIQSPGVGGEDCTSWESRACFSDGQFPLEGQRGKSDDSTSSSSNRYGGSIVVDTSDPLLLLHSDHPGIILVNKLLNGDNYGTWSRSMSIALSAKNKTCFIDGTVTKPASSAENFLRWKRCNDMVLFWILNSIEPDLANSVIYAESAAEVWADLKERFSQNNTPRIFQIERDIASLQQDFMSIAVYFTKLKGLWDELSSYNDLPACTCDALKKVEEREQRGKVIQFLMGLNESYSAVRGQILLMQPLPPIGRVYSMIINEEKQRDMIVSREAMLVDIRKNNYGNNSSHKTKTKMYCSHCNGDNHTIDRCYYLQGFPTGHKSHRNNEKNKGKKESYANNAQLEAPSFTNEQYQQLLALLNNGDTLPKANVRGNSASSRVKLKPSLLEKKREGKDEMKNPMEGHDISILRSGMVLLRGFLSLPDQIQSLMS